MKKPNKSKMLTVTTGTIETFIGRSMERARKLDRGEKLPAEIRLTFENPADLMRALSAQRIRLIYAVRRKSTPVSELASSLKRDPKAVRRDVSVLESLGLVKIRKESNPGHGLRKIVEPLAQKYHLLATI